jgi:aspartate kinase
MAFGNVDTRTIDSFKMSTPLVFKFGGASVKDADSVRNVARIIGLFAQRPMVVVVSAMGKTTNAFEEVVGHWSRNELGLAREKIGAIRQFHFEIIETLFEEPEAVKSDVQELLNHVSAGIERENLSYGETYDFIVHHGELISTKIIAAYVGKVTPTVWQDTRLLIHTDDQFRRATVRWDETTTAVQNRIDLGKVNVVQGFIGATASGIPTTLGREGSDYTGAVFAFCLGADSLTIWKDVPGMLNADPKIFQNTTKIDRLPFNEAIELAFYGASIIHPKTIQPLKKKGIPLHIKSFVDPTAEGTTIGDVDRATPEVPNFILKKNQALLQLKTKDLAFIAEHHLSAIYQLFADQGVVVNLMRNTATKAVFCINHDPIIVPKVMGELTGLFDLELVSDTALLTIRHYREEDEQRETEGLNILLEQRTPDVVQFVFKRF